jgi:hypothetical protein
VWASYSIVRGFLSRPRIILSDTGIECSSGRRRRFARWTSLGSFGFAQSASTLSAELIGPDADPDTIKAGKFTVSTLLYGVGTVSLLREIQAYHKRALERCGQMLPDPQSASFDIGPPPARQRSWIGSTIIVFTFDWLALQLGIALVAAVSLVTKSASDKTDIACLIGASLVLGGFLGTRKRRVDRVGALIGSLLYVASVVAVAELWHPAVHHGTVLLIEGLAVPVFVGLGTWRGRSKRGAARVY